MGRELAIDLSVIESFADLTDESGAPLIIVLINLYLESTPGRIAQVRHAVESRDAKKLEREAHSLKSSSGNLGVRAFSELCAALEKIGESGQTAGAAELSLQLEAEWVCVRSELQTVLASHQ